MNVDGGKGPQTHVIVLPTLESMYAVIDQLIEYAHIMQLDGVLVDGVLDRREAR